ncbi:hypothetical protein [Microcoleus sp. bin38.metabat.b11b12b14.051]|uniref:hypothetical protein n=1 Tax=Microcoleus sp. bin38.metabat.b11b12b14.051 TaxID=2742709 RepID=UPI0025F6689E|nr:hypothetical protein [Microcoleus sp. bin38.metabat.b11b12b14.051]
MKYVIIIIVRKMEENDLLAGIAALGGCSSLAGSITIATVPIATTATVPAAGVAGWLGLTTTATTIVAAPVTLPIAGIVAAGALLTYGGYKAYKFVNKNQ